jgi:7,8-dihydropterin-6-yl-methyl-4-(beta-D-ribofuranosyl)aminobenzene 5'-phosphate synthase
MEPNVIEITMVFNNVPQEANLTTGWGLAALIRSVGRTVLFDTGHNGDALLHNLHTLGHDPAEIDTVVLSHHHDDHTGGLAALLEYAQPVIHLAPGCPQNFGQSVQARGCRTITAGPPVEILPGVVTTGAFDGPIPEHGLVFLTDYGPALLTGCAHPGILNMVNRVADITGKPVQMILGGFHLKNHPPDQSWQEINALAQAGVRRAAPSHCTGDGAMRQFRDIFGPDFVRFGLGGVVRFERNQSAPPYVEFHSTT